MKRRQRLRKEELKKLIDTAAGRIPADTGDQELQVLSMYFPERSQRVTSATLRQIRSQESATMRERQ